MEERDERARFIPYRKAEIVDMICADGSLDSEQQKQFRAFCKIVRSLYRFEFQDKLEALSDSYYPFDPDKDTQSSRKYSKEELVRCEQKLVEKFEEVLNDANYERISESEIELSLQKESLFKISLRVDFDDFERQLVFGRGETVKEVTSRRLWFWKKTVPVATYERVAVLIKFKKRKYFQEKKRRRLRFKPGSMVIKLFKNIPKADIEMLFPNTQVQMKLKDKMLLGIPALIGGIGILSKGFPVLAVIPVVIVAFNMWWTGEGSWGDLEPKIPALIAAGTGVGAVFGYGWRQWDKYRNRKIQFMKTLSDNLYFKNLDNNSGVFHHLIDAAEQEECKEAILSYYFLLVNPEGLNAKELDGKIEQWFTEKHSVSVDFEIDDALRKLKELQLCEIVGDAVDPVYKALPLAKACERLDYIWDNYFQYNGVPTDE